MPERAALPSPVRLATPEDLESWLHLAREVEPLFGPMPDLADHIARNTGRGTAFVVGPLGAIDAAMLLSRDEKPHHINWLGVTGAARRRGYARALVSTALQRWPAGRISVVTFTEDLPDGRPARRLYERMGFTCAGPTDPAPNGGQRDLFVLDR